MVEPGSSIEAIRKRPGMYVGDIADGTGLHRLMWEVLNNALAEAWAGRCDRIEIEIHADGAAAVRDNGGGMSVELFQGEPAALAIMTALHSGGRFDQRLTRKPEALQGAGVVVTNALSERLDLRIWRDGGEYRLGFRRGGLTSPLARVGDAKRTGTEIIFRPDPNVFGGQVIEVQRIDGYLRSLAHVVNGVSVAISDLRSGAAAPFVIDM